MEWVRVGIRWTRERERVEDKTRQEDKDERTKRTKGIRQRQEGERGYKIKTSRHRKEYRGMKQTKDEDRKTTDEDRHTDRQKIEDRPTEELLTGKAKGKKKPEDKT